MDGLAIENGHQRAIVLHGTHLATLRDNVISGVRGASIYIEDGNEMYNRILYNVAVCPWALSGPKFGCTVPGTGNDQADTSLNQAGIWALSSIKSNHANRDSHVRLWRLSVSRCCAYPPAPRIGINLCAAGDQQCLLLRLAVPPLNAIGSTDLAR